MARMPSSSSGTSQWGVKQIISSWPHKVIDICWECWRNAEVGPPWEEKWVPLVSSNEAEEREATKHSWAQGGKHVGIMGKQDSVCVWKLTCLTFLLFTCKIMFSKRKALRCLPDSKRIFYTCWVHYNLINKVMVTG
jgi:hypothetical protein